MRLEGFLPALVVLAGLVGCSSTSAVSPASSDAGAAQPIENDAGGDAAADAPAVFRVEVRGEEVPEDLRATIGSIATREIGAFVDRNPTVLSAFEGHTFLYRAVDIHGTFSGTSEASLCSVSLDTADSAYGATCPVTTKDSAGNPLRVIFIRNTEWTPITAIHETVHVVHMAVLKNSKYNKAAEAAYAGSTVTLDGADNAFENVAYKAQFFLTGEGDFLERAKDPAFSLLTSWFGRTLFPEYRDLAARLQHSK